MHIIGHGVNNRYLKISKFSKSVQIFDHYDVITPKVAQNYGYLYKQLNNGHQTVKLYTGKYFGTRRTMTMPIFQTNRNPSTFWHIMTSYNPKNWKIGQKIRQKLDFFKYSRIIHRLKAYGERITYLTKKIRKKYF